MLQGHNSPGKQSRFTQFIFLVNFMSYWIRAIRFLLIWEQGLHGYATQPTIESAAGLFIMRNRIASALFNFQVMVTECLGFYLSPVSNALYLLATLLSILGF